MNEKERIYELAEKMSWMEASPIYYVKQYFRNQGYTKQEINEALKLVANVPV